MKVSFARKISLGFGIAAAALIVVGAASWWNAARYKATFLWVDHTHRVLDQLDHLQTDMLGMQMSVRDFALNGREEVLQPYHAGDARIEDTLQQLKALTADNASQQQRLARAAPLVARARAFLRDRIEARRTPGLESARDADPFLSGLDTIENLRGLITAMAEEERRLLQERLVRMNRVGRATLLTIAGASTLSIALVVIAGFLLRRDLAARVAAETALRLSDERTRLMIASVQDYAIVMLDPHGQVTTWNAGAHQIKGYSTEEIVGQHFSRFYPAEAIGAGAPETMLAAAAVQGHTEAEGWRVRKDGSRFWAHVVVTAVRNEAGELIGFIKLARDLTERRAAEQKIEALNDDLRRRAALLEAANRELEAFSYSVSHDLRAPLRHIDGFAALLAKRAGSGLDAEGQRYLRTISASAKQMGQLIDDLLAFSRIGRMPLRREMVAHRQLVNHVIAEAQHESQGGPPVDWDVGALPDVQADPAMLRQVWRNLLDNAVKYSSKQPQPRIAIGATADAAADETVFFVRDNGVGFDMTYADKLFGVFQRLHSPAEFEGTGIGLANVRRIVSRHGGRTWAEAQVGVGATFYFSLPLTPPAATF